MSLYNQMDVNHWRDIVTVSCSDSHTIGLKSDGTVIAIGCNDYGQCNTFDWRKVISISCGVYHTIGLCSDGTAVATGRNSYHQCDIFDWYIDDVTPRYKEVLSSDNKYSELANAKEEMVKERALIMGELKNLNGLFKRNKRINLEERLAYIEKELKSMM